MFSRIRIALGLVLSLALITSITVFAKGSFSFITIAAPDSKDVVRATDPALTSDFFTFADFSRDKTKAPADPGAGYEITRYYIDGKREIPFDRLHYYPETGFVYYDGIVNGSSEYDGEWYTARTEIKGIFESVLSKQIPSGASHSQPEPIQSVPQVQASESIALPQSVTLIAITAGLALILLLASRLRKPVAP
ncbi:MAG TPA: hypothetical protein VJ821_13680 [Anaerolineales bacterium]|nr:hypothetical protein [Anaerolineales bacterium]